MEILKVLLVVVEVVSCLLLVGVILLQKSKSEGLGLAFGSGMGETLFGSRAGNVLTKITVTLGLVFLGTTAILGILFTRSHETSIIDQRTAPLPMFHPLPRRRCSRWNQRPLPKRRQRLMNKCSPRHHCDQGTGYGHVGRSSGGPCVLC
jgi:preprotein translocase subunit SecG